jgi:hypothetical protein
MRLTVTELLLANFVPDATALSGFGGKPNIPPPVLMSAFDMAKPGTT